MLGCTQRALCALALFSPALTSSSCAATHVGDAESGAAPIYVSEDGSYRLELPQGWKRSGQTLTRDGWEQQTISFNAGRVAQDGDRPIDASAPGFFQALQEELTSQTGVEVVECGPTEIDGVAGFRMHFLRPEALPDESDEKQSSAGGNAPQREYLTYGVLADGMLFVFSYEAPAGDGFARDLAVFERMVRSFQRSPTPPGAKAQ